MQEVTGSSPVPRTKSLWHLRCHRLFFCCITPNRQGRCRKRNPKGRILYAPSEVYPAASGHGRIWNPPLRFLWRAEPPRRGGQEGGAFLPVVRASGFISAFALSKTILCGILFLYKSTGKPGANRRRKAIGAHRVSQLPTRIVVLLPPVASRPFWGRS